MLSLAVLPIIMSSMQPITASNAVSAAEELEEEKNKEVRMRSFKDRERFDPYT